MIKYYNINAQVEYLVPNLWSMSVLGLQYVH